VTTEIFKIPVEKTLIGPLNKFTPPVKGSSLYRLQQDRRCLDWLDTQAPGTVVYVSFGSLAAMDPHVFVEAELAWGLADSNRPFVWVVRPSLICGFESGELPDGFQEEVSDRGRIIDWAPQDEVLAHPADGGFLTHNGFHETFTEPLSSSKRAAMRELFPRTGARRGRVLPVSD
jgi:hypothetical protein